MKDKLKVIDRDQLKYIAAILIFIGHFLTFTVKEVHFFGLPLAVVSFLTYPMYIAPPIFMFFIAEGFTYTKSKTKYVVRLLITGLITQVAFVLANSGSMDWDMFLHSGNIILTLLISLLILIIYNSELNVILRVVLMLIFTGVTYLWKMEWAVLAPLLVFALYVLRNNSVWRFIVYEIMMLGYVVVTMGGLMALVQNIFFVVAVQIPIIMITFFYNGKKGRFPAFSKWFFYIFYPAHLFFIFIVKNIAM